MERTARDAIWKRRLQEEEEKEERGRATRGGMTADAVEDSTGPAGSRRLPDDSVEVIMGDSGLSWVASSRGGGAVSLRASQMQCARAVCVRPVAPVTAERGQPSNVFCYKGSTYLLFYRRRKSRSPAKPEVLKSEPKPTFGETFGERERELPANRDV